MKPLLIFLILLAGNAYCGPTGGGNIPSIAPEFVQRGNAGVANARRAATLGNESIRHGDFLKAALLYQKAQETLPSAPRTKRMRKQFQAQHFLAIILYTQQMLVLVLACFWCGLTFWSSSRERLFQILNR